MGVVTGGGAAFNGGTITQELVIDTGSTTAQALELQGTRTTELDVIKVDYPHMAVELDSGGFTGITSDNGATLQLNATADSIAQVLLSNAPSTSSVTLDAFPGSGIVSVTGAGGTPAAALDGTKGILVAVNAAPASGDISAGWAYIWFDQTNGAAALGQKAKTADGTIVTGKYPLRQSSGSLATTTFSSGTGKQVSTTQDVYLVVPCTLNPTAGAAGTVAIALSPDNVTYSALATITEPAGIALDGTIIPASLQVPAGWYVKLTATNATIGTGTYY